MRSNCVCAAQTTFTAQTNTTANNQIMNISYKWLKEYVDFSLTPQQVADALTSEGLEVDSLEEVPAIRGGLKGIVVGEVLECDPHPDSDHMHVCSVNL